MAVDRHTPPFAPSDLDPQTCAHCARPRQLHMSNGGLCPVNDQWHAMQAARVQTDAQRHSGTPAGGLRIPPPTVQPPLNARLDALEANIAEALVAITDRLTLVELGQGELALLDPALDGVSMTAALNAALPSQVPAHAIPPQAIDQQEHRRSLAAPLSGRERAAFILRSLVHGSVTQWSQVPEDDRAWWVETTEAYYEDLAAADKIAEALERAGYESGDRWKASFTPKGQFVGVKLLNDQRKDEEE